MMEEGIYQFLCIFIQKPLFNFIIKSLEIIAVVL